MKLDAEADGTLRLLIQIRPIITKQAIEMISFFTKLVAISFSPDFHLRFKWGKLSKVRTSVTAV